MRRRKTKIGFFCLLMIIFFCGFAFGYMVLIDGSPNYFEYKRTITIQGSKVAGPSTQFPMLFDSKTDPVDLQLDLVSPGKVRSADGYDIVFATADGAEILSHEIEYYVPSTGEYIAWVKVDLTGSDQDIFLYYGRDDPNPDTQHINDVWSKNFVAVWHLKETTGGSDAIKDSTGNGNHGTDFNFPTFGADGKIGNAISFDGGNDWIRIGDVDAIDTANMLTVSAWVHHESTTTDDYVVSKNQGTTKGILMMRDDVGLDSGRTDTYKVAVMESGTTQARIEGETGASPLQSWTYVAFTYQSNNASGFRLFVNGTQDDNSPVSTVNVDDIDTGAIPLRNAISASGTSYFHGMIDELRIADWARGGGWIWTEWNNQNDPESFYTVGDAGATLVELSYFRATSLDSAVLLEWATETELDNEGFNLWRSEEKDGQYARMNPYFIPGEGDAGFGAEYSYTDYDVQNGVIYYYKLEDIDINGKSTFYGPIPAIPNDILLLCPIEREKLRSGALLFSWVSSSNYSFKVEISLNPSFPGSETFSFPEERWINGNSLWLNQREWEMVLSKNQQSGGQLFWRVRAKYPDGIEVFSDWRRFVVEKDRLPDE